MAECRLAPRHEPFTSSRRMFDANVNRWQSSSKGMPEHPGGGHMAINSAEHERPWVAHYPPGIEWDVAIDTTPVHEQVLRACAATPDADALDFLGKKTRFRDLARQIDAFAGALQQKFGVKKGTRV